MERRRLLSTAAGATLAASLHGAPAKKSIIALTWIRLRNSPDQQLPRLRGFFAQSLVPAFKRAGSGPVGIFSISIGSDSPSVLVVNSYGDLAAMDALDEKLRDDKEFRKASDTYNSGPGLAYQRAERSLAPGVRLHAEDRSTSNGRPGREQDLRSSYLRKQYRRYPLPKNKNVR